MCHYGATVSNAFAFLKAMEEKETHVPKREIEQREERNCARVPH